LLLISGGARAQPIIVSPQKEALAGSSLANLRLRNQSADGAEAMLTVDFVYDGLHGSTARLLPVIADRKQPKISASFGANPVTVSSGRGTVSLRVKFFSDEPGAPLELSSDHVRVLMFADGGNSVISQGIFSMTIKWGRPNSAPPQTEKTRLEAEASEKARQNAEAQTKAEVEAKAVEDARIKADADEKARQEAEAKRLAKEGATKEAEAKRVADAGASAGPAATAQVAKSANSAFLVSSRARTKVKNVDVVSRNIDRTEMLIAVEYQYSKEDGAVRMGVDLESTEAPGASGYFSCPGAEVGKGGRNFVMLPVKLNAAARKINHATLPTDKLWVYLADASGQKSYIFQGTMMLVWNVADGSPGDSQPPADSAASALKIESFKQNDLFSGYVTVQYDLRAAQGRLHLRVFDSANPAIAAWFASDDVAIKSGPGMELVRVAVPKSASSPDVFSADTVEVQLLDSNGTALASARRQSPMSWAKPK
jgi:hypothetical protein